MKHSSIILSLLAGAAMWSCQDENLVKESSDRFTVSANTSEYKLSTSRSGDIAYRMFFVENPDGDWLDADNSLVDNPTANGLAAYTSLEGGVMTGDNFPTLFKQRKWYFYGVTQSTAADPNETVENAVVDGVPHYSITRGDDNLLPDVRWGTSHKAYGIAEATGGVVPVDFTHALSRLEIYIGHSTVKANGEAWTSTETLQELSVTDHVGGVMDMKSGDVSYKNSDMTSVSLVNASNIIEFGVESRLVTSELLVFPGNEIQIHAKVSGRTTESGTVISDSDGNPITFEPNVSYKLYITYLEDGTYVITAFPQYYDWVDNEDGDLSIGQPTLINGVVWADRNLGATSAAYTNLYEWEEMRGYYYQMGRNIPYKVYTVPGNICTKTYSGAGATNYSWIQTRGDTGTVTATSKYGLNLYPYIRGMWEYLTDGLSGDVSMPPYTYEFSAYGGWSTSESFNNSYNHFYSDADATEEVVNPQDGSSMFAKNYYTLRNTTVVDASGNERILYIRLPHSDYYEEYVNKTSRTAGMTYDEYMINESEKLRFVPSTSGPRADNNQWAGTVTKMWSYQLEDLSNALQPCPAGWRIPTCDEWASIFPVSEITGDITFNPEKSSHKDKYSWAESTANDPTDGFEARYYCVRDELPTYNNNSSTDDNPVYGDLYIIKKYGTNEAYGLKLSLIILMSDPGSTVEYPRPDNNTRALNGRGIIVVTRYSIDDCADAYMESDTPPIITNRGTDDEMVYSVNRSDPNQRLTWRPVESLALPACGVANYRYNRLIWSGTEAQYAAVDKDGNGGVARIKVAGSITSRYVYIDRGTYSNNAWSFAKRFVGLSIRPVRDASVIW